jgi:hypothetical protein
MAFQARALCVPYIGHYEEAVRLLDGKHEKFFDPKMVYRLYKTNTSIRFSYHDNCVVEFHSDGTKTIRTCNWDTPSTRNVINTQLRRSEVVAHKGRTVFTDSRGKQYYLDAITIDAEERYVRGANPVIVIQEDLQIKREIRRELKTFYLAVDTVSKLNNSGNQWFTINSSVRNIGGELAKLYVTGDHRDLSKCMKILTEQFSGFDISSYRDEIRNDVLYELAAHVKPFQTEKTLPLGEIYERR